MDLDIFEGFLVLRDAGWLDDFVNIELDVILGHIKYILEREDLHIVNISSRFVRPRSQVIILVAVLIQSQIDLLLGSQSLVRDIHLLSGGVHMQLQQRCIHQYFLLLVKVIFIGTAVEQLLK